MCVRKWRPSVLAVLASILVCAPVSSWQLPSADNRLRLQRAALTQMRDAVNRRDARAYAAVYSPKAIIRIFGSATIDGRQAIEQYEANLFDQFPDAHFAILESWHRDADVVAHYAVNAKVASGASMGHEGLLLLRFDAAGEIELEDRYQDSLTPMAQLGALHKSTPRALPPLPLDMRSHSNPEPATETRNMATLRRVLAAMHSQRRQTALPELVADGRFDELILPKPFIGKDAASQWIGHFDGITDTRFEVTKIVAAAADVLVFGVFHGVLVRPIGVIQPSPKPFAVHRAIAASLDNRGRIQALKGFMNGKELAEQLGQWPLQ